MQDLRPIYYHEARARLVGNRLAIYDELLRHGPCTAKELAAKIGWEVTSVRPRLTELREIHHVTETGHRRNGEHEFRALSSAEAQYLIAAEHRDQALEAEKKQQLTTITTHQPELFA